MSKGIRIDRLIPVCLILAVAGCIRQSPQTIDQKPDTPVVSTFDPVAAADALAKLAEHANDSKAFEASEVIDGTLNQAEDFGLPADFVAKVRTACPAIKSKPPCDLDPKQVEAIRGVR